MREKKHIRENKNGVKRRIASFAVFLQSAKKRGLSVDVLQVVFHEQFSLREMVELELDDFLIHQKLDLQNSFYDEIYDMVRCAIDANKVGFVRLFVSKHKVLVGICNSVIYEYAACHGYLDILQSMHAYGCFTHTPMTFMSVRKAIENGHLHILKWLQRLHVLSFYIDSVEIPAAKSENVDVFNLIQEQKKTSGNCLSVKNAARNGHFDVLKFLHDYGCTEFTNRAMDYAASMGHLEIVKFLHFHRTEGCTTDAMDLAAYHGHLETVVWLHENRTESCTWKAMDLAARNGHLDVVKWLYANFAANFFAKTAINCAAINGHFEIVKFLHENQDNLFGECEYTMDLAAANNYLEIVKCLHFHQSEGCTSNAMDEAAANGHLEAVKWLHFHRQEGCTTNAMDFAASNGHLEIVIWLHENRTEGCTTIAMNYAAGRGFLEIVKFLHFHRHECCSSDAINYAASNGHLEVVKFLHFERKEVCTTRAMDYAARGGHLEVVEFLHANRTEGCTTDHAMHFAARYGHLEVVEFLYNNKLAKITITALFQCIDVHNISFSFVAKRMLYIAQRDGFFSSLVDEVSHLLLTKQHERKANILRIFLKQMDPEVFMETKNDEKIF